MILVIGFFFVVNIVYVVVGIVKVVIFLGMFFNEEMVVLIVNVYVLVLFDL